MERNVILTGDVREQLRTLPDESVHCVVTSPPYWGLRDYGVDGQMGLEATPEEYVCNLVDVFREVRRVLRRDGTVWLNMGDCYAGSWGAQGRRESSTTASAISRNQIINHPKRASHTGTIREEGLKPKDLVGQPWRVAFALQADGWWLRSDIIWSKPNPMPESVTDRPTRAHEYLFLLTRQSAYYYDADAIREPFSESTIHRLSQTTFDQQKGGPKDPHDGNPSHRKTMENLKQSLTGAGVIHGGDRFTGFNGRWDDAEATGSLRSGRNKRTVWEIATEPYAEAHFATFPTALVKPCILVGTSEHGCCPECGNPWQRILEVDDPEGRLGKGYHDHKDDLAVGQRHVPSATGAPVKRTAGWQRTCDHKLPAVPCVVLDPFMGSGTTALVALRANRDYVGIELNAEYVALAEARLQPLKDQGRLL